jgi:hypothetical protein
MLPLLWASSTVAVPSAVFIADGCPVLETYAENRTSSAVKPWISYYTACRGANPLNPLQLKANSRYIVSCILKYFYTFHSLIEAQQALNYTETHDPTVNL